MPPTPPLAITKALLTVNYRSGRRAPVDTIVVHVTEGDAASVVSWFTDRTNEVSAHYLVKQSGEIVQFVGEENEAWTQGRVHRPTAAVVVARPSVNPNAYCVSIEHEGDGTADLVGAQRAASIALIRDIARRHVIAINRHTVIGHHEIYSLKRCPGAINLDTLVAEAAATSPAVVVPAVPVAPDPAIELPPPEPPPMVDPNPPRLVWSNAMHDFLVVTQYVNDDTWWFAPLRELETRRGRRSATPLSQMLLERP